MQFDDRLATVLRADAGGTAAARTQFRQLLDLLGTAPADQAGLPADTYRQLAAEAERMSDEEREQLLVRPAFDDRNPQLLTFLAYRRVAQLGEIIPGEERSRILREPGLRLRNRRLVAFLAEGDAKPAAAAVATARLGEEDWLALVPQLPPIARGFLRHRRDLPPSVREVLAQLGVRDNVLPLPESAIIQEAEAPEPAAPPPPPAPETAVPEAAAADAGSKGGIRALRQRIEAFREARRESLRDPRLPLEDEHAADGDAKVEAFTFSLGTDGRVDWAEDSVAPLVVGMKPGPAGSSAIAILSDADLRAIARRQVLHRSTLTIAGSGPVSGEWELDAVPQFSADLGAFTGYVGRMRRRAALAPVEVEDSQADRMRQILHELRTPVNAIQGFAEIIQQQIFGPAPNEYRAHAAAIAVDAAKLLAGFDEVDRLSRLETGALELEPGDGDLREVVHNTLTRLDGVLRPRNSGFKLTVKGDGFSTGIDRPELMGICWRIFASLASSLGPSETAKVRLSSDGETISLRCRLPASLAAAADIMAVPIPEKRPAISSGTFGSGFSLRLARAEVQSVGGSFDVRDDRIMVKLPVLTGGAMSNSTATSGDTAA